MEDNLNKNDNIVDNLTFKCILVGSYSVGKTSISSQFSKNIFPNEHNSTVGMGFFSKNLNINDKIIKVLLWDTAGQERFKSITKNFYKKSDCCFLVFDVTDNNSFLAIDFWYNELIDNMSKKNYIIYLIGNKIDLVHNRKVSYSEANKYAQKRNIKYFETSAKNDQNIYNIFSESISIFCKNYNIDKIKDLNENAKLLENITENCQSNQTCCY